IEKLGYSFILGGAIGNIIDRIYRGFVIDMIDFRGIWVFVFNLADVWINIGVILIIVDSLLDSKRKKKD
ncbi:MAG: signal peptidase II, partial [Cetobacterium somerae]